MKTDNHYKGQFAPKNPSKYKGNVKKIIYRSSWELRFMNYCDMNNNVLEWSSEELVIPYKSPVDGKVHRYFPDFYCKLKNKYGREQKVIVEIKPKRQCVKPERGGKKSKTYITELKTWGVNRAKWDAAETWCKKKGLKFVILTEDNLTNGI